MPRPLRIGIIGCGKIAHIDHVPGYKNIRGVEVVSLLDVKPSQMRKLNKEQGIDARAFKDWGAFVASGVNAVSICTPNNFHYSQTLAAFEAGLHVLCEKPMAAFPAEAKRMVKAARKAHRVLQINQTLHYLPVYQKTAELVAAGTVGHVTHIRCIRSGGSTPDKNWSPGATWFVSKESQGGLILDIGVHMADLMRWVAGEITHVAAYVDTRLKHIDVPDNVSALMRFANGATGVLELSWTTPCGAGLLEVYGTKGTLRLGSDPAHPIEISNPAPTKKGHTVRRPKVRANARTSQQHFIDAIRGKGASPTPGELGFRAVALCDAMAKSGESGRFVRVKTL